MSKLNSSSKEVWSEIKKAKNILLTLHPSPDGDSIGSNLALLNILTKMKKNVTLIRGDSEFPQNFISLPGTDKIIPKNFLEINQDNFDLFIIVDIAGFNQITKKGEVCFSKKIKTIIIDHHATNTKFADINLVDSKTPAACQVVYSLLKENKIKISKEAAVCLIVGIYTDTGGFKYPNTTSKTFSAATELSQLAPDFNNYIFAIENNEQPLRLKFISLMLGSIETYCSGKIAIASVDFKTIKENKISDTEVNGSEIANIIKSVNGWDIGICLTEYQQNSVKFNFRTRDSQKYPLDKIATSLGGGGHHAAAAAVVNNISIDQAKKILIEKISQIYNI